MGEEFMELPNQIARRIASLSWPQFRKLIRYLGMDEGEYRHDAAPNERTVVFRDQLIALGLNFEEVEGTIDEVTNPRRHAALASSPLDIEQRRTLQGESRILVFLCYNRKDLACVRQFKLAFQKAGLDCWMDEVGLHVGKPWYQAIEKAMMECKSAVIFLGTNGLGRTQEREIGMLVERHNSGDFRALIPAKFHPEVVIPSSLQVDGKELLPVELVNADAIRRIANAILS